MSTTSTNVTDITTISPRQLHAIWSAGQAIELIDVRTPAEFRALHAEPARNVPLDKLDAAAVLRQRGAGPLYVICHSGGRARKACAALLAAGGSNIINVEGGTSAWTEAGLPVVRGKKAISIERQVRLTVGTLVLASGLLGWLVHPAWFALAALMGAGLVFAGVTDTCGLGLLLARMPWNQAGGPDACGCQTEKKQGVRSKE